MLDIVFTLRYKVASTTTRPNIFKNRGCLYSPIIFLLEAASNINPNEMGRMNPFNAPTITSVFTGLPMVIKTKSAMSTKPTNIGFSFFSKAG